MSKESMIKRLLIANRGEIALRVIRSAKAQGIHCIALYSDADVHAPHVIQAHEAYHLGPSPAKESYLNQAKILEIAKQANACAIHPGYGFLSENAHFAQSCEKAQIIFVGPPSSVITAMASKARAKILMQTAKVPTIPGYNDEAQDSLTLEKAANKIGFPLLLKAASGGGGKGMRIVHNASELPHALAGCQREALAHFNDDRIIIEKYLEQPRHIEVQIFGDTQGNVIHLFERDCSLQRRYQKIIEEAPAPNISKKLRHALCKAAIDAAKAVNYIGAGTVEFLVDSAENFYFMEMNTRLQVEHPITEMITGLDLVAWQLTVANGEPLPLTQKDIQANGHAIEARLYAEDPSQDFLPSCGEIIHLQWPHTRVDTGIEEGSEISMYYDPMLAKIIVHGKDRAQAMGALRSALGSTQIVGVTTNLDFLWAILQESAFCEGRFSTQFVDQMSYPKGSNPLQPILLASLYVILKHQAFAVAKIGEDIHSPWSTVNTWRMNLTESQTLHFMQDHDDIEIYYKKHHAGYQLTYSGNTFNLEGSLTGKQLQACIDEQMISCNIIQQGNDIHVMGYGLHHCISLQTLDNMQPSGASEGGHLLAPMPGAVVAIMVKDGEKVAAGQNLMVIEAMKMEHTIRSPQAGMIEKIHYALGDQVNEGDELVSLDMHED